MPMTWDHEADVKVRRILTHLENTKTDPNSFSSGSSPPATSSRILTTSNVKPDYEDLANHMGPDCTIRAIQHRIQRLRAIAAADGDSSAPATPEKRKRGRPKKNANGDAEDKEKASPKKAKKDENGAAVDDA